MASWFKMQAGETGKPAEISIYDEIGGWGIPASQFADELKALGDVKDISLRVNSPGGDVFQGLAMFNLLDSHPATITAHVDGIAASAASLVVMAADKIMAPENAFLLVHEPYALTVGSADAHLAMAADLERMTESFAGVYAKRSGQTQEQVRALMKEDRLMGATEAKVLGYVDDLGATQQMAASFSLDKIPAKFREAVASALPPSPTPIAVTAAVVSDAAPAAAVEAALVAQKEPVDAPVLAKPAEPIDGELPQGYGQAEISATIELCSVAGSPAAKAREFISAKTPLADVRTALIAAQAERSDRLSVDPIPAQAKADAGWDAVIAKVNAEFRA